MVPLLGLSVWVMVVGLVDVAIAVVVVLLGRGAGGRLVLCRLVPVLLVQGVQVVLGWACMHAVSVSLS